MKRALALAALVLTAQMSWLDAVAADAPAAEKTAAASKPDPSKGQEIVNKVCVACHGADGNAPAPANPKLAGQIPEYVEKQLNNFKPDAGGKPERASPVMAGFAAPLSADDVRNLAAYFSGQKPALGAARNKDTVALGQKLWRGGDVARGLPACASCHGPTGAGLPTQFPRIAGQHADYTEAQLRAFRSGDRANDPNKMMRTIAARLSDAEIKAVSDYADGLK